MAAAALLTLAVVSRTGSLALAAAALAVKLSLPEEERPVGEHRVASDRAMEFMWTMLAFPVVPCGAVLLLFQLDLLFDLNSTPFTPLLAAMVVLELVLACGTLDAACRAVFAAVARTAVNLPDPAAAAAAVDVKDKHLAAASMACVAGILSAVSALWMLWMLGSRFHHHRA